MVDGLFTKVPIDELLNGMIDILKPMGKMCDLLWSEYQGGADWDFLFEKDNAAMMLPHVIMIKRLTNLPHMRELLQDYIGADNEILEAIATLSIELKD